MDGRVVCRPGRWAGRELFHGVDNVSRCGDGFHVMLDTDPLDRRVECVLCFPLAYLEVNCCPEFIEGRRTTIRRRRWSFLLPFFSSFFLPFFFCGYPLVIRWLFAGYPLVIRWFSCWLRSLGTLLVSTPVTYSYDRSVVGCFAGYVSARFQLFQGNTHLHPRGSKRSGQPVLADDELAGIQHRAVEQLPPFPVGVAEQPDPNLQRLEVEEACRLADFSMNLDPVAVSIGIVH